MWYLDGKESKCFRCALDFASKEPIKMLSGQQEVLSRR